MREASKARGMIANFERENFQRPPLALPSSAAITLPFLVRACV